MDFFVAIQPFPRRVVANIAVRRRGDETFDDVGARGWPGRRGLLLTWTTTFTVDVTRNRITDHTEREREGERELGNRNNMMHMGEKACQCTVCPK